MSTLGPDLGKTRLLNKFGCDARLSDVTFLMYGLCPADGRR